MEEKLLLKIKKELCKYSNIPKVLYDYIENANKKDAKEHLIPVITNKKERKTVLDAIDNLFKKDFNITKLSPDKLIKTSDFHPKDTDIASLDAVLAELRTIIFLDTLNLYNIIPLQAKKDEKCADFIAAGGSDRYAIEVFCKISQSPRRTEDELKKELKTDIILKPLTYEDDLFRYYIDKSRCKKIQLDNTAKKYKCNKGIMVMVLNDPKIFGFLTSADECTKILSKISTELDWGSNYYFAIITGLVSLDIIYPSITL